MTSLRPLAALALLSLTGAASTQSGPAGFTFDVLVQQGMTRPTDLCFLPGGRMLIADQPGNLLLFVESAGSSVTTVGSIPNVTWGGERGLLSVIADPGFATNGYVYVLYTSSSNPVSHLDRFTLTGDLTNPTSANLTLAAGSRRAILELPQNSGIHNGGSVRFGPDGKLYVSVGDDFSACDAQDPLSRVGCLLRIDCAQLGGSPNASPPSLAALDPGDNPLSGTNDFRRLLLAIGLRNPFRMEIDPVTHHIYLADVGGDAAEELDEYVYQPGAMTLANYGWPWREGSVAGPASCPGSQPGGLTEPVMSYLHLTPAKSIVVGSLYRNQGGPFDFGPSYEGSMFSWDFFDGQVTRSVNTAGSWQTAPQVPGQPSPTAWADGFQKVTCMRVGPDGALYYLQFPHSYSTSILVRVHPTAPGGIEIVAGDEQIGPAGEPLTMPLTVRVRDSQGLPVAGAPVTFVGSPGVTTSPAGTVQTNASGIAQSVATAPSTGGAFAIDAISANPSSNVTFHGYSRRLTATTNGLLLTLAIDNATTAPNPQVPYVMMLSFPGSPTLPTIVGPLCIDPSYALAIVIEDGIGAFGGVSFSGAGGVGSPGLSRTYSVPVGLFTGLQMVFQAIGFDAVGGWFRTNCETRQF